MYNRIVQDTLLKGVRNNLEKLDLKEWNNIRESKYIY